MSDVVLQKPSKGRIVFLRANGERDQEREVPAIVIGVHDDGTTVDLHSFGFAAGIWHGVMHCEDMAADHPNKFLWRWPPRV